MRNLFRPRPLANFYIVFEYGRYNKAFAEAGLPHKATHGLRSIETYAQRKKSALASMAHSEWIAGGNELAGRIWSQMASEECIQ